MKRVYSILKTNTHAYLYAQLWRVVRIRHLGTNVEAEIRVVFDVVVAHAYCRNASYGHHLLQQHGFKDRIQTFGDVLQQDGRPKLDGVLDGPDKICLCFSYQRKKINETRLQ